MNLSPPTTTPVSTSNNAQAMLDSFFTVNNTYSTDNGLFWGLFTVFLLLLTLYFFSSFIFNFNKNPKKEKKFIISPKGEKIFQIFRNICIKNKWGEPLKKWKTYQEYLDFKYEENFKITNSHTPKDIQSQQHNLKIARVMYIFLAPFIIFLLLRQISGMIENINYIDIQDNSTAIVYYHFTPNKIILKNEISHFGIKNKSKEIRKSNSSGTRTHYYCEISIILKNGEHKTFDVYSLYGSFQYCRTKKFTIQYN